MRGDYDLDQLIVFGQGPVKSVLLHHELTDEQRRSWSTFIRDPLATEEPDFFVVEGRSYLSQLPDLSAKPNITGSDKNGLTTRRSKWQRLGRFALKRMGRQNALAAGALLLAGVTREVILTGGPTLSNAQREVFLRQMIQDHPRMADAPLEVIDFCLRCYLLDSINWPSEAELMIDVIERSFGPAFYQKYGQSISTVLHKEPESRNTIENVVFSINRFPQIAEPQAKVGILSADHHVARCALIASMFSITVDEHRRFSAQRVLLNRSNGIRHRRYRDEYARLEHFMMDIERNGWLQRMVQGEIRFRRGLTEDDYLTYWFGYTFSLEDPKIASEIVSQVLDQERHVAILRQPFWDIGIDIDLFKRLDLETLSRTNPEVYRELLRKLSRLTQNRAMPPEVKEIPGVRLLVTEQG